MEESWASESEGGGEDTVSILAEWEAKEGKINYVWCGVDVSRRMGTRMDRAGLECVLLFLEQEINLK
jgi:hypothetical protein